MQHIRSVKPWPIFALCIVVFTLAFGPAASADKPVGVIKNREYVVEMYKGADARAFTVKNHAGEIVANKISEAELQQRFPALYEFVAHGLKGPEAKK